MTAIDLGAHDSDVAVIRARGFERADVALVLGSGLDSVVDALGDRIDVPYSELSGMQGPSAVVGHAGTLALGRVGDLRVMCFRGRVHRYQGVSAYHAAYPARLAHAFGAGVLVVTNAAGSVDPAIEAGRVMLIADHLNLTGDNPLVGWPGPEGGTPFVGMGEAYDAELRDIARACAAEQGLDLAEGVYAGLLGPTYETPAEVRYLRLIGANAVGMSTVPEVIVARALGIRVLGLSLITNAAGGAHLSHDEVIEVGRRGGVALARLIGGIVARRG